MKNVPSLILILFLCLSATKVHSQEITVFPGFWAAEYYQDDKRIKKSEFIALLRQNKESIDLWNKSKLSITLAGISFAAETGFALWTLQRLSNDEDGTGPAMATLGAAVGAAIFYLSANKKRKGAILTYNQSLDTRTTFTLEPSKKGLGLVLRF